MNKASLNTTIQKWHKLLQKLYCIMNFKIKHDCAFDAIVRGDEDLIFD